MLSAAGTAQVFYYFYYVDGLRAGEAQLHSDGSFWAIEVYPAYRGKGHGEALVRALIDAAYVRGFGRVWLFVHEDNAPAISLYEKLGFRRNGITRRGIHMSKEVVSDSLQDKR